MSELEFLPDVSLNYFNFQFNISFIFTIFQQGPQIAFEIHLSFQNLREDLFPLLKSALHLYALEAIQNQKESLSNFSTPIRVFISLFKCCDRIPEYSAINRKKGIKNLQWNSVNRIREPIS